MKYVYIVQCSKGEWDGYCDWIDSVYATKKGAEKRKAVIMKQVKNANNQIDPIKDIDNPTPKQLEAWERYFAKYNTLQGQHEPCIFKFRVKE